MPTNLESDQFQTLPGVNTKLFRSVWGENRLLYQRRVKPDATDQRSARLITAAVGQKKSLLIVLPDEEPRRPAFLLTTALMTLWWSARESKHETKQPRLLYFGSHVGVREQLGNVSISEWKLDLASVFDQTLISRRVSDPNNASLPSANRHTSLPCVKTAYSPIDPDAIIRAYEPDLVAVDLADVPQSEWFERVVTYGAETGIPIVAWGTNALSTCVRRFEQTHSVFVWPPSEFFNPTVYPTTPTVRHTQAVVLAGDVIEAVEIPFRRIYGLFHRASKAATTPLEHRAIAIHWNYLRALESMAVPLDLYEAQAPTFWGLRSIQSIREACEKFRESVQPSIASELERATQLLDQICDTIAAEPPIWTALTDLCVDPAARRRRVITFTGRSRKQLFLFAILARYNMSTDDLRSAGTEVWSLDEFPRLRDSEASGYEAVMGTLPSPLLVPKLFPLLTAGSTKFILFPHQLAAFQRRLPAAQLTLWSNLDAMARMFSELGARQVEPHQPVLEGSRKSVPHEFPDLFCFDSPAVQTVDANVTKSGSNPRSRRAILKETASVDEITRLFESGEIENSLDVQADAGGPEPEIGEGVASDSSLDFVAEAIDVLFTEPYRVTFPSDYSVQVIATVGSRPELKERYVAALRTGDRILYIQGQRRQNLYDLIVSRVHKHAAFELHLAIIRRWQEDLRLAFLTRVPPLTVEQILERIKELGSDIKWPITIRSWIQGERLCPDDPRDLNRIANVMNLTFVANNSRQIHKAAVRIRGIHIGLALRLNSWLDRAGVEAESDAEIFDQELGLTFGDFRHSLVVLTVDSTQRVTGPFLRSALGQLEKL